jgi:hypothetical protein
LTYVFTPMMQLLLVLLLMVGLAFDGMRVRRRARRATG